MLYAAWGPPTQHITWLGLNWNGENCTISIAAHRLEKLASTLNNILKQTEVTARQLAQVVGQIVSTGSVTGNLARILSRHCQISIAAVDNWDSPFSLDKYCLEELNFWLDNVHKFSARVFKESIVSNKTIYTDANKTACGAHIQESAHVAHRAFTPIEQEFSSTYRELLAIHYAILAFEPLLHGCNVKILTDSQMVMKIVQVGSMKIDLHKLATSIFSTCFRANIQLDIQWIPRSLNARVDYISRFTDLDDWEVKPEVFHSLNAMFGPHTVDCFANYKNAKIAKFYSRFWNPGSAGVDPFYQDWSQDLAWLVPPVSIVPRVLKFMFENKLKGTLVSPYWTSAVYWPLLTNQFARFIGKSLVLTGNESLCHGHNQSSLLGSQNWQGHILVCSLDFSIL